MAAKPFLFALSACVICGITPFNGHAQTTDYLTKLGAAGWHQNQLMGQGIRIAILDSGFRNYKKCLGTFLPDRISARSFRFDGDLEANISDHGLLCAEVVHAIAPAAQIILANWEPDRPDTFVQAVRWCRNQGAHVMTCSVVIPSWSDGNGGGGVHVQLKSELENCLFFASAGNLKGRCWSGKFRGDGGHCHQWQARRTENAIQPWGDRPVSVELTAGDESRYDLRVFDEKGELTGEAQPFRGGNINGTTVRFQPRPGRNYRITVKLQQGTGGSFRLITLGADIAYHTNDRCSVFPGDGRDVFAVGAASVDALVAAHERKPDFVASATFPTVQRARPFVGTSAAAPQVAAMAALLWSKNADKSPLEMKDLLRQIWRAESAHPIKLPALHDLEPVRVE